LGDPVTDYITAAETVSLLADARGWLDAVHPEEDTPAVEDLVQLKDEIDSLLRRRLRPPRPH
jgi:hypothetical protein